MPLPRFIACIALCLAARAGIAADCGESRLDAADALKLVEFVERQIVDSHVGSVSGLVAGVRLGLEDARRIGSRAPRQRELADTLNRALVPLRDAHLEVRMLESSAKACRTLPVEFEWNSAGLWVRSGVPRVPTGARVVAIGALSTDDLEVALGARIPHETPQWVRAHGANLLPRIDTLRNLGLVSQDGTIRLRMIGPDGSRRTERLQASARPDAPVAVRHWVGFRIWPERSTGHFWFDRFDHDAELVTKFDEFLAAAARADVHKIAIDIRGNPGGDSSVAVAMLDALGFDGYSVFTVVPRPSPVLAATLPMLMPAALNPMLAQAGLPPIPLDAGTYELPPALVLAELRSRIAQRPLTQRLPGRQLYLLTDAGTFSSGTLFAVLVRDNHLGRIVGEAAGNSASFNGTEYPAALSGTDYYLNLTTARLLRPDAGAPADASIEPDDPVTATGADLAAGRDVQLDFVLDSR